MAVKADPCPVYGWKTSWKALPDFKVSRDEAVQWIRSGKAATINGGRAIRLLDSPNYKSRDHSATMGPCVIEAYALGQEWAKNIVHNLLKES